jgi:hypothetical protein
MLKDLAFLDLLFLGVPPLCRQTQGDSYDVYG